MTLFHISKGDAVIALKTKLALPNPGDKLRVAQSFNTPAFSYRLGDVLELIERTDEAPYGVKCSLGNWRVKDKFFTSVWSNIEWAMADGVLEIQEGTS